jgi:hypothetical protein
LIAYRGISYKLAYPPRRDRLLRSRSKTDTRGIRRRVVVPLKRCVSMLSKAYQRLSRKFVAHLGDRKSWILLINWTLRIPYFEPGGRRFESLRAHKNFCEVPGQGDILAPFLTQERVHDKEPTEPSRCLALEDPARGQRLTQRRSLDLPALRPLSQNLLQVQASY